MKNTQTRLKSLFFGADGVRAGWRALAFLALVFLIGSLISFPAQWLLQGLHIPDAWFAPLGPGQVFASELQTGVIILIATGVMAWFERRSLFSYGFTFSSEAMPRLLHGLGIGIASATVVALSMLAFGGMQIQGIHLHGMDVLRYSVEWALAMVIVGISEEATFRGYLLVTLKRGLGFWPAALLLSALFVLAHAGKPGENMVDFASLFLLAVWGCVTFLKTGSLWLIVGFHMAFDFMQMFVIGTPNGSQKPIDSLLNATFLGPAWVNGGVLGTEASYFIFPVIGLLFAYIYWRYPKAEGFN